jgi:hypothetical protein
MVLNSNLAILLVHIVFPKQILAYIDTFNIFFAMGQLKWLIAQKQGWMCEAPQTS